MNHPELIPPVPSDSTASVRRSTVRHQNIVVECRLGPVTNPPLGLLTSHDQQQRLYSFSHPCHLPFCLLLNRSENTAACLPRPVIGTCHRSSLRYDPRSASMLLTFSRFISLALPRRTFFRHCKVSRSLYFVLNESISASCLPTSHTGPEGCKLHTYAKLQKSFS